MATTRLRGFGWFVLGVVVAPPCYLISSWVAAERARVESLERAIVAAKREIRDLETEFQTRANHAQLEQWNGQVLALAAPRPDQFLAGEEALAQLHGAVPGEAYQAATYIVPAGLYDNRLSAPVVEADAEAEAAPATEPTERKAAPQRVALAAAAAPAVDRAAPAPAQQRRAQAVAMLDTTLLSDRTLGDLAAGARKEAVVRR